MIKRLKEKGLKDSRSYGWMETLNRCAGLNPMSVPADKYFTDLCFPSTEFKGLFKEDR
jgi:hypothetical protein